MLILKRETSENAIRWYSLQNKIFERKIAEVFKLLRNHQIEPILIKGWAAARSYPAAEIRAFSDIDVCVKPELYQKAKEILRSVQEVDLHEGFRHLDLLSWNDLFDKSKTVEVHNVEIRVLSEEDHLRVLCVHWLTDGGAFKDKLWDIFYLLDNREADFDWERFLDSTGKVRRRWFVCVVGLAHLKLGLDISDTPFEKEAEDLPGWFLKSVEKEWRSDVRLVDLRFTTGSFKNFYKQLKKRFPPNAVQATVLEEGDFEKNSQLKYQWKNFFRRLLNSVKKTFN